MPDLGDPSTHAPSGAPVPSPAPPPSPAPHAATAIASRLGRAERTALFGLLLLASLFALHAASAVLLPIALSVLLALVFQPVLDLLGRWMPRGAAAALLVVGVVLLALGAGWATAQQVGEWVERAPDLARTIQRKLGWLVASVEQVREAAEQVERAASPGAEGAAASADPSVMEEVFARVQYAAANLLVVVLLLYFMMARGRETVDRAIAALPSQDRRERYDLIARTVRDHVGTFLGTIALINAVMGVIIGGTMWLLGLPNPVLWGVLSALMKFVPMIGGTVTSLALTVVSVLTYEDWRWMLVPPVIFLVMNWLEGNILTPMILGRRMTLNPLGVILSIVFWGWLWGVVGAIMAVPILATIKIVLDNHPTLARVGAVLGEAPPKQAGRGKGGDAPP
jgi:predicted PurR-regulated permease PerM